MKEIIRKIHERSMEDSEAFLESEDFANLVDSIAVLAKTQGNIFNIEKSVHDLKELIKNNNNDDFTFTEQMEFENVVDAVEDLVHDLSTESYGKEI